MKLVIHEVMKQIIKRKPITSAVHTIIIDIQLFLVFFKLYAAALGYLAYTLSKKRVLGLFNRYRNRVPNGFFRHPGMINKSRQKKSKTVPE